MLTPQGSEELGKRMRLLADRGLAVIFITHKLSEAYRFGDRISVLKRGRLAGEIAPQRLRNLPETKAIEEMVRLMFGVGERQVEGIERTKRQRADIRLAADGLSTESGPEVTALSGVTLDVAAGEILGVAGIDGNGQKQHAEALSGQRPVTAGQVILEGRDITRASVGRRRKLGLRYLTDDRLSEGSVSVFPVAENTVLKEIGESPYWVGGIERRDRIAEFARHLIRQFSVHTPGETTPIGHLSGGNIQKLLLGRELSGKARAVIFNKPTYGLDIQNIAASRARIRAIAENGIAVLLISTDLDELIELADRIVVMDRGRVCGELENDPVRQSGMRRRIGMLMVGEAEGAVA